MQNDAIPALMELCLYYASLNDGVDQAGAQLHKDRYDKLLRGVKETYSNPSKIIEPRPLTGHRRQLRYGRYSDA